MHTCPLCDKQCTLINDGKNSYDCASCGRFWIDEDFVSDYKGKHKMQDFFNKAKYIALERKLKGEKYQGYFIHNFSSQEIAQCNGYNGFIHWSEFIKDFPENHEIPDRALLNLGNASGEFGIEIILYLSDTTNNTSHKEPGKYYGSLGLLFTNLDSQAQWVLNMLKSQEYITVSDTSHKKTVTITAKGWAKIAKSKERNIDSKQIFVAMWFDSTQNEIWEKGIKPGIEGENNPACQIPATGYQAKRIDKEEHVNKICDEIIANIRKSRALVADFTGHRGGVYYEAGFAMGLGIPVIWLVNEKEKGNLHFDTRQYNHIIYKDAGELKKMLNNRIKAIGL